MGVAILALLVYEGLPEPLFVRPNFVVHASPGFPEHGEVTRLCEQSRAKIHRDWLGLATASNWQSPCQVVIHRTRESYLAQVGRGGIQTRGCSSVRRHDNRVVFRRIDLLLDADGRLPDCLAHEVAHVVLADWSGEGCLPRWADEGIAVLADSESKQARYRRQLYLAAREQRLLPLVEVLTADRYPATADWAGFYGQSVSLVECLLEHDAPATLITFVETATRRGYDRALRDVYEIDGIGELEHVWRSYLHRVRSDGTVSEVPVAYNSQSSPLTNNLEARFPEYADGVPSQRESFGTLLAKESGNGSACGGPFGAVVRLNRSTSCPQTNLFGSCLGQKEPQWLGWATASPVRAGVFSPFSGAASGLVPPVPPG